MASAGDRPSLWLDQQRLETPEGLTRSQFKKKLRQEAWEDRKGEAKAQERAKRKERKRVRAEGCPRTYVASVEEMAGQDLLLPQDTRRKSKKPSVGSKRTEPSALLALMLSVCSLIASGKPLWTSKSAKEWRNSFACAMD